MATAWELLVRAWDETTDDDAVSAAIRSGGLLERLDDEHLVALPVLLDGLALTHELTEAERTAGVLALDPDLAPLLEPVEYGLILPGGAPGRLSRGLAPAIDGPPGWLEPWQVGTALCCRLQRAQLVVESLPRLPSHRGRKARVLAGFAHRLLEHEVAAGREAVVELRRVAWAALAFGRDILGDGPWPPLSAVMARAGLVTTGEWLHPDR